MSCKDCKKASCPGNCHGKPVTQYVGDLPIDNLESIVDYIIGERDIVDEQTGNTIRTFVRVPGAKVYPNGSMDNIIALEPNNTGITIPANQVRAVYVANESNSHIMRYADSTHPAVMLAVGKMADLILVQNCGFVNIPATHNYIVGVQYYLGANGEPTADAGVTGQKLFIPVSSYRLAINM